MYLFECMLLEKKIILISSKISRLSSCINALAAIVYPFSWQVRNALINFLTRKHVFIPILPKNLIEFVEAPMPYIIGMLESLEDDLSTRYLEAVWMIFSPNALIPKKGTVIYHLDNGNFLRGEEKVELIPRDLHGSLLRNLNKLTASDIRMSILVWC